MTPNDKILNMKRIFDAALNLAALKSSDYSGDTDSMQNFRAFGWKGIVVRLSDKIQRLIQFSKKETFKVKDESMEDTLLDIINYAALTLIMYREGKKMSGSGGPPLYSEAPVGDPKAKERNKILSDMVKNITQPVANNLDSRIDEAIETFYRNNKLFPGAFIRLRLDDRGL